MFQPRDLRVRHALATFLSAVLLGSLLATSVSAVAVKSFSATVDPEPLVAGASYGAGARAAQPVQLTVTNTSTQASLGSMNITAPEGIVLTSADASPGDATLVGASLVEVRSLGLAPGQQTVISLGAQVECASNNAPYTWAFNVKQANDFNGTPGNDLTADAPTVNTVTGTCQLAFAAQPQHAEDAPVAITSVIYDPAGDPVQVAITDATNTDKVAWWSGSVTLALGDDLSGGTAVLGGTTTAVISGGSASLAPTISRSASGYSLLATATPTAGTASVGTSTAAVESASFNIVDDASICGATSACSATAGESGKTKATVAASSTNGQEGDLVILSINDPTLSLDCAGYVETSDLIVFDVTASDGTTASGRSKTLTMTLAAENVTKSASKYEVCWFSPIDFKTKSGAQATTGLLPTCANRNPVPPCIVSKGLDRTKDLVIVVSAPPGDPRSNF